MKQEDKIPEAIGLVVLVVTGIVILIVYFCLKDQARTEKGCGEEHTTMTSETFKCPADKPYVHLSVMGNSANAVCCAKE